MSALSLDFGVQHDSVPVDSHRHIGLAEDSGSRRAVEKGLVAEGSCRSPGLVACYVARVSHLLTAKL